MFHQPQNENGNNTAANTTLDDGRTLNSTLTGSKSAYSKTINHYISEHLHATTSFISNQINSGDPLQRRSSDNPLIAEYRSRNKSTQEQICDSCEDMKSTVSKLEESLKHLNYEVEQICEFIKGESKSEKQWYYKLYEFFVSQKLTSNNTEGSTCTKLQEIAKFIKTMQQNFNKQHNLMVQKDRDIERFQKEIVELESNLSSLKLNKNTTIDVLNKQILTLKEIHAKEIHNRDNSLVFWQDKFDMKYKQWKDLEKGMIELIETFNKDITSMQGKIDEKDMQLENYSRNLDITSNTLRHETIHRERLQGELKRIQKLVVVKENALGKEKEKFRDSLSEKIKLLGDYNDAISLEDVALQAENQFVLQTIKIINKLKNEGVKYEEQVDNFSSNREDKSYLHIKEMLVRILEKLDAVESQNNEEIQTERRNSIIYVKKLQGKLDKKARANDT